MVLDFDESITEQVRCRRIIRHTNTHMKFTTRCPLGTLILLNSWPDLVITSPSCWIGHDNKLRIQHFYYPCWHQQLGLMVSSTMIGTELMKFTRILYGLQCAITDETNIKKEWEKLIEQYSSRDMNCGGGVLEHFLTWSLRLL